MIVVYRTDVHHSYQSRDLIGITSDQYTAIDIIEQQVKKDGEKLSEDDLYNLNHIKQTQKYNGEGEFMFEYVETDVLL